MNFDLKWVAHNPDIPTHGERPGHDCFEPALKQLTALEVYRDVVTETEERALNDLEAVKAETLEGFRDDIRRSVRMDLLPASRWLYNVRDRMTPHGADKYGAVLVQAMYALLTLATIINADLTPEQFAAAMLTDGRGAMTDFVDIMGSVDTAWGWNYDTD